MRISIMTVVSLGWLIFLTNACRPAVPAQKLPAEQRVVTIGTGAELLSGLIFLADEQGLFAAQGLTAKVRDYPVANWPMKRCNAGKSPWPPARVCRLFMAVWRNRICACWP